MSAIPTPDDLPADAEIVVMDASGYTDDAMRGEPYMWTWIGASTWHYVRDYPVPVRRGGGGKGKARKRKAKASA